MAIAEDIIRTRLELTGKETIAELEKLHERVSTALRENQRAFDDTGADVEGYEKRVAALTRTQEQLTRAIDRTSDMVGKARFGGGSGGMRNLGMAALEASRAVEDLQYGIAGVVNNIPSLTMALGGSMGLTALISLLAVGVNQVVNHWSDLSKLMGMEQFKTQAEQLEELAKKTTRTAQEQERLNRAKRQEQEIDRQRAAKTGVEAERQDATREVIDQQHRPSLIQDLVKSRNPKGLEGRYSAENRQAIAKIEESRKRAASLPLPEAVRKGLDDRYQKDLNAARRKAQDDARKAESLRAEQTLSDAVDNPVAHRRLIDEMRKAPQFFGPRARNSKYGLDELLEGTTERGLIASGQLDATIEGQDQDWETAKKLRRERDQREKQQNAQRAKDAAELERERKREAREADQEHNQGVAHAVSGIGRVLGDAAAVSLAEGMKADEVRRLLAERLKANGVDAGLIADVVAKLMEGADVAVKLRVEAARIRGEADPEAAGRRDVILEGQQRAHREVNAGDRGERAGVVQAEAEFLRGQFPGDPGARIGRVARRGVALHLDEGVADPDEARRQAIAEELDREARLRARFRGNTPASVVARGRGFRSVPAEEPAAPFSPAPVQGPTTDNLMRAARNQGAMVANQSQLAAQAEQVGRYLDRVGRMAQDVGHGIRTVRLKSQ